jgi:hypothetical protein
VRIVHLVGPGGLVYKRFVVGVLLSISCASPQRIEEDAVAHERRAAYFASIGDPVRAERERAAAEKQRLKAAERAATYKEAPVTPPLLK